MRQANERLVGWGSFGAPSPQAPFLLCHQKSRNLWNFMIGNWTCLPESRWPAALWKRLCHSTLIGFGSGSSAGPVTGQVFEGSVLLNSFCVVWISDADSQTGGPAKMGTLLKL